MPITNCEINLILTWSYKCVLSNDTKATTFAITDTKLYVLLVTFSSKDNANLLQQLKSSTINWSKYQSKVTIQLLNPYLDHLLDPIFQGVNRLFGLLFEITTDRTVHTKYYLPTVEIKDYNVMFNRQNFFNQPVKSN